MGVNRAGMAQSLAERGAGALLNELFAVAENSEQLSSRFPLLGNLFEIPNWPSLRLCSLLSHTTSQHRYSHNLLRFLLVHHHAHRRRRRRRRSARRRRHLLVAARGCQVIEKLPNVDLSRLEDGDMLIDAGQPV
jgi:hypothetical protein